LSFKAFFDLIARDGPKRDLAEYLGGSVLRGRDWPTPDETRAFLAGLSDVVDGHINVGFEAGREPLARIACAVAELRFRLGDVTMDEVRDLLTELHSMGQSGEVFSLLAHTTPMHEEEWWKEIFDSRIKRHDKGGGESEGRRSFGRCVREFLLGSVRSLGHCPVSIAPVRRMLAAAIRLFARGRVKGLGLHLEPWMAGLAVGDDKLLVKCYMFGPLALRFEVSSILLNDADNVMRWPALGNIGALLFGLAELKSERVSGSQPKRLGRALALLESLIEGAELPLLPGQVRATQLCARRVGLTWTDREGVVRRVTVLTREGEAMDHVITRFAKSLGIPAEWLEGAVIGSGVAEARLAVAAWPDEMVLSGSIQLDVRPHVTPSEAFSRSQLIARFIDLFAPGPDERIEMPRSALAEFLALLPRRDDNDRSPIPRDKADELENTFSVGRDSDRVIAQLRRLRWLEGDGWPGDEPEAAPPPVGVVPRAPLAGWTPPGIAVPGEVEQPGSSYLIGILQGLLACPVLREILASLRRQVGDAMRRLGEVLGSNAFRALLDLSNTWIEMSAGGRSPIAVEDNPFFLRDFWLLPWVQGAELISYLSVIIKDSDPQFEGLFCGFRPGRRMVKVPGMGEKIREMGREPFLRVVPAKGSGPALPQARSLDELVDSSWMPDCAVGKPALVWDGDVAIVVVPNASWAEKHGFCFVRVPLELNLAGCVGSGTAGEDIVDGRSTVLGSRTRDTETELVDGSTLDVADRPTIADSTTNVAIGGVGGDSADFIRARSAVDLMFDLRAIVAKASPVAMAEGKMENDPGGGVATFMRPFGDGRWFRCRGEEVMHMEWSWIEDALGFDAAGECVKDLNDVRRLCYGAQLAIYQRRGTKQGE
jgi:hypothetical protein